ncbi:MAG: AMP-binding protein [Comamonadaceae bacterium]|nr:AMP-binding protein [Comamonadaceae bacterium]
MAARRARRWHLAENRALSRPGRRLRMPAAAPEPTLLHELVRAAAARARTPRALTQGGASLDYAALDAAVDAFAGGLLGLGLARGERVGIYLEKRFETVIASFGAPAAGGVFVPMNPLLKPEQVAYILRDCDVRVLVTSPERLALLAPVLRRRAATCATSCVDRGAGAAAGAAAGVRAAGVGRTAGRPPARAAHRVIDTDMVGDPLHQRQHRPAQGRGAVATATWSPGAKSVASYLENHADDTLLAALPLSLRRRLQPADDGVPRRRARGAAELPAAARRAASAMEREQRHRPDGGAAAVHPADAAGVAGRRSAEHLRYFANTGGRMPRETLDALRARVPQAKPFLMYGLTEAFRSTYLPPEEVDRRPDSIGKAIPNAEILVLREDGTRVRARRAGRAGAPRRAGRPGLLERRREDRRALQAAARRHRRRAAGLMLPEIAVFSRRHGAHATPTASCTSSAGATR